MLHWLARLRIVAALALAVSLCCQGTGAFAGTTGTLSGTVTDAATHQALPGAKVTVTSPSQTASVVTDGSGHFTFLSLDPDTYLVSVTYPGYDQSTLTGVTIIADNQRVISITSSKTLKTIGKVTSRASNDLVKPGTTADVIRSIRSSKIRRPRSVAGAPLIPHFRRSRRSPVPSFHRASRATMRLST